MNRHVALDHMKLLLAFMVVGIHSKFLIDYSVLASYLFVNGIFRAAVPIFFIVSGYYFFNVLHGDKVALWLKRVFILYIFWMLVYSYSWIYFGEYSINQGLRLIRQAIVGYFHLWYLPGLIGAAVLVNYLHKLNLKLFMILIGMSFIAGVFIQYAGSYHMFAWPLMDNIPNYPWTHRNFIFLAFPFFGLGFIINKLGLVERADFGVSALIVVVGLALLILESYNNYSQLHGIGGFDNLFSLMIICPALFIMVMKINMRSETKYIALLSSGIYFVHPLFLDIGSGFVHLSGTLLTTMVASASLVASVFLLLLNKKLKFIL